MSARVTDVAVNLLWLVPGRVGGSEQYLARQLLGLPSSHERRASSRLLCQRAFAETPTPT